MTKQQELQRQFEDILRAYQVVAIDDEQTEDECLSVCMEAMGELVEWWDTNAVRNGQNVWRYKGDNFEKRYCTDELLKIYANLNTK